MRHLRRGLYFLAAACLISVGAAPTASPRAVEHEPPIDLTTAVKAPPTAFVGSPAEFVASITYKTNPPGSTITDVGLHTTLGEDTDPKSVRIQIPAGCSAIYNRGEEGFDVPAGVGCSVSPLANGQTKSVTIMITPLAPGTIELEADVGSWEGDPHWGQEDIENDVSRASVVAVVAPPNRKPIARPDTVTTAKAAAAIRVLANDRDPDGDALRVTSVTKPRFGTARCTRTTCRYVPGKKYASRDSFQYTVTDARGATATARVTVRYLKR